jgi:hypothetical protein
MAEGFRDGLRNAPSAEQLRQARQAMSELQGIVQDQQALLDETFRRGQLQSPQPGMMDDGSVQSEPGKRQGQRDRAGDQSAAERGAENQEALRKRLGRLMESLDQLGLPLPESLGQAERAMRNSSRALRQHDAQAATEAQNEALTHLRDGSKETMQAMGRQMGGFGLGQGYGGGRDPLGRQMRGPESDETVKIPEQSDMQKAREVLDELRKRSGDAGRPPAERDYLQRLLRQF